MFFYSLESVIDSIHDADCHRISDFQQALRLGILTWKFTADFISYYETL
jgi:hypothetical protein